MKYAVTMVRVVFFALFMAVMIQGKMMLWLGLIVVSAVAAALLGRVYCGYICPIHTAMEPLEWAVRTRGAKLRGGSPWLGKGVFAWLMLVISIAVMLLLRRFWQLSVPIIVVWLVIAVLLSLRYRPEMFHNLICPFGALQNLFGRFARFTTHVHPEDCTGCRLCEKTCPAAAIHVCSGKAVVNPKWCLQCARCQRVCPTQAIHYGQRPAMGVTDGLDVTA